MQLRVNSRGRDDDMYEFEFENCIYKCYDIYVARVMIYLQEENVPKALRLKDKKRVILRDLSSPPGWAR